MSDLKTLVERKNQDIERGVTKDSLVFPPIVHTIAKDDLTGNPEKLGKISIKEFPPGTSAREIRVASHFLKRFQKLILGKKPPQKRVRPKHKRDKLLAEDKPVRKRSVNQEITFRRKMDDLIENETKNVPLEQLATAEKRPRKRYIQAKYRYLRPSRKTS